MSGHIASGVWGVSHVAGLLIPVPGFWELWGTPRVAKRGGKRGGSWSTAEVIRDPRTSRSGGILRTGGYIGMKPFGVSPPAGQ
jgi:hypothetical protein